MNGFKDLRGYLNVLGVTDNKTFNTDIKDQFNSM